jgi:hypothetical protein
MATTVTVMMTLLSPSPSLSQMHRAVTAAT